MHHPAHIIFYPAAQIKPIFTFRILAGSHIRRVCTYLIATPPRKHALGRIVCYAYIVPLHIKYCMHVYILPRYYYKIEHTHTHDIYHIIHIPFLADAPKKGCALDPRLDPAPALLRSLNPPNFASDCGLACGSSVKAHRGSSVCALD